MQRLLNRRPILSSKTRRRMSVAMADLLEDRRLLSASVTVNVYLDPNQTAAGTTPVNAREVFVDLNGDNTLEVGEPTALTNSAGTATLLVPGSSGTVQIGEVLPDGVEQTLPASSEYTYNFSSPPSSVSFGNLNVAPGSLDASGNFTLHQFSNLNSNETVTLAVTEPDGKLVVAGTNGSSTFVARYFSNGVADLHFSGPDGIVTSIGAFSNASPVGLVVEPNGGIVVALNQGGSVQVVRINPDGSQDLSTFNQYVPITATGRGLALMVDGSLLLTTYITQSGLPDKVQVYNLNPTTGLINSGFGPDGGFGFVPYTPTTQYAADSVITTVNASGGFDMVMSDETTVFFSAHAANGNHISTHSTVAINEALPGPNPADPNYHSQFRAQSIASLANGNILVAGTANSPTLTGGGGYDPLELVMFEVDSVGNLVNSFGTGGVVSKDDVDSSTTYDGSETASAVVVLPIGEILVTDIVRYDFSQDPSTFKCVCREFNASGGALNGYGGSNSTTNQLVIDAPTQTSSAPLAELSGVLPSISASASNESGIHPALNNPSIGFNGVARPVMLTGRAAADLVVEKTVPSSSFVSKSQANITTVGSTVPEILKVRYTDEVALRVKTLGSGNLSIRRANGSTLNAIFLGVDTGGSAQNSVAEYSVLPASGAWGMADTDVYHVDLLANQVKNANQSAAAKSDLATFNVSIAATTVTDTTAPTAVLSAVAPVTTVGSAPLTLNVTYTDNIAVKLLSVGASNLTVAGPGGVALTVVSASANSLVNAASITVTYSVAAPAGGWTTAANGTYPITLSSSGVTDTVGNPVAGTALGSYVVAVGVPSGTLSALPDITTTGITSLALSVTYTDSAAAIRTSSLGNANLTVTGPNNSTLSISGTAAGTATGSQVVVTYTVTAPAGGFAIANNGIYTVRLIGGQVTDTSSNAALAATLGAFTVNIVAPIVVSPPVTVVGQTTSSVVLSIPVTSVQSGNIVLFNATVTGSDGGTPTGTITFSSGESVLGTAILAGGSASFSLASLSAGDNAITAAYSGDATYANSTSASTTVSVTAPPAGAAALVPGLARVKLPASLVAGVKRAISVPVLISNTGTQTASGIVQVNLYASLDGSLDAGDALLPPSLHHNLKLKAGKSAYLTIRLKGLPASLGSGTYHLLAQVIDAAGFAQTVSTDSSVTVAAPFINPVLSFSRVTLASTLTSGARARGSAILTLLNTGNVAITGPVTIELLLSSDGTASGTLIKTVIKRVNIAAGKAVKLALTPSSIPLLAMGTYQLAAIIQIPAANGASAATASAVDPVTLAITAAAV